MSIYRKPPAPLTLAPPAPWWRLLRAWYRGTLDRLTWAQTNRRAEMIRRRIGPRGEGWVPRGWARVEQSLRDISTGGPS